MAMGQGRDSAGTVALLGAVLLCLLIHSEAVVYTVGDAAGWSFLASDWPGGKSFRAGDKLVFNYNPSVHNVAVVDAAGYNSCSASAGSQIFTSGNDVITLGSGTTHFICTFPGHCQGGMKIAITAA